MHALDAVCPKSDPLSLDGAYSLFILRLCTQRCISSNAKDFWLISEKKLTEEFIIDFVPNIYRLNFSARLLELRNNLASQSPRVQADMDHSTSNSSSLCPYVPLSSYNWTSITVASPACYSINLPFNPTVYVVYSAFHCITLWIVLEMYIRLVFTFIHWNTMYFW
jgi:hypothetical protein